jgi:cytochrome c oxidase cbb3-type subunit I/II
MPPYPHLLEDGIPWSDLQDRVDAMAMLGVPYGAAELKDADGVARTQAETIAAEIAAQGGPADLADREIIAMIAYLQRLGTDIQANTEEKK